MFWWGGAGETAAFEERDADLARAKTMSGILGDGLVASDGASYALLLALVFTCFAMPSRSSADASPTPSTRPDSQQ